MKNKEDNKLTYYLITIILTISIIVPIIFIMLISMITTYPKTVMIGLTLVHI